jgi:hypothetical protein
MEQIREYLIGVTAAAILCGIATAMSGEKGFLGSVMKLLTGLLMALALVSPWVKISLNDLFGWTDDIKTDANAIVQQGQSIGEETYRKVIKERLEAYIQDEAQALGLDLSVEVSLAEEGTPVPVAAELSGSASPYLKQRLALFMDKELGIAKEDQTWLG